MPDVTNANHTIYIGTASWSIPKSYAASFPRAGTHLERYASIFPATEINSSFYRPHSRTTYQRWAASVPDHFRFSVKAPKAVTHSDWRDISAELDRFQEEISGLGQKLGPVLIQLPPKRAFENDEADRLLAAFRSHIDGELAFEPRNASWFQPKADDLMLTHRIARVAADPAPATGAEKSGGWRGLNYTRLHGSPTIYRSSYSMDLLKPLADTIVAEFGSKTWCIFDNTASYAATGDALALRTLVDVDNFLPNHSVSAAPT